jgi:carnosine N-methyltransferase
MFDEEEERLAFETSRLQRPSLEDRTGSGVSAASSSTSKSDSDEEKERAHFQTVLNAFDTYLAFSLAANNARRRSFYSLPRSHRLLLSTLGSALPGPILDGSSSSQQAAGAISAGRGFKARLDEIDDRIRRNADVLSLVVQDSRNFLSVNDESDNAGVNRSRGSSKIFEENPASNTKSNRSKASAANHNVDKVRSTLKQFVRDWSTLGAEERRAAYTPIIQCLLAHYAQFTGNEDRSKIRILVPGAGLGRLAFDIASHGFSCQGNEFSFYMLLAAHFVLNKSTQINEHVLYPFVHSSSNWRTAQDMLRPVCIPDVNPSDLPSHVDFSMVAGEFVEVYSKEAESKRWNAVATCFFIDTARNFARYLEVLNHVLPVNGVWINVGPLLWHYEGGAQGDISIELTMEEVLELIELMGFVIEEQHTLPRQTYTGNANNMLTYEYAPEFWKARKVRDVTMASEV